jgi:hypothetical protein
MSRRHRIVLPAGRLADRKRGPAVPGMREAW